MKKKGMAPSPVANAVNRAARKTVQTVTEIRVGLFFAAHHWKASKWCNRIAPP